MSDPETALCCMIVSNPTGGERPHAWQKRVNDHMRAQAAEIARLTAEISDMQGHIAHADAYHSAMEAAERAAVDAYERGLRDAANAKGWEQFIQDSAPSFLSDWQRGLVAGQRAMRSAILALIPNPATEKPE